jgi:hypothetical protein
MYCRSLKDRTICFENICQTYGPDSLCTAGPLDFTAQSIASQLHHPAKTWGLLSCFTASVQKKKLMKSFFFLRGKL